MKKKYTIILFLSLMTLFLFTTCNKSDRLTKLGWKEMRLIHLGYKTSATMALNYFDMALLRNPNNTKALHGIGIILTANKKSFQNGVSKLEKSFQLDKKYIYPYIDLAIVFYKKGLKKDTTFQKKRKFKKMAIETIERGLKANPKSINLFLARANFFSLAGKFKEADKDVAIAKSLNPNNPNISYSLALINFNKNNLQKVLDISTNILQKSKGADTIATKVAVIFTFVLQKLERQKNKLIKQSKKIKNKKQTEKIENLRIKIESKIKQTQKLRLQILKRFKSKNPYYKIIQKLRKNKIQVNWPIYAFPRFIYEN